MMKLKLVVVCSVVFLFNACESHESGKQQVTSEASVMDLEKTDPVEPPIIEQPVVEESKPQEPALPVVAAVSLALSGEAIYKKSCMACHASGAANAPKLGDKAAWKPRIEKGMNALLQSAINGVPGTAMMKRGNCASCSDDDLKTAIEYMVMQSR